MTRPPKHTRLAPIGYLGGLPCPECGAVATHRRSLAQHRRRAHGIVTRRTAEQRRYYEKHRDAILERQRQARRKVA